MMLKAKNFNKVLAGEKIACENHFASGRNFYKLFWVFTVGAFLGFLVETLWCFYRNGHFEWRAGLAYAPFNPVYGIGAVALYTALYKFNRANKIKIFATGVVAGSFVEYFCSLFQERAFGTVSWDYSNYPLNIGSRICLKYSVFWGLLALTWVSAIGPALEYFIEKIPSSIGKPLTWIMFAILAISIATSTIALFRWVLRFDGIEARNFIEVFFDKTFPDERMLRLYPNMKFIK